LLAGSVAELVPGEELLRNTSLLFGPDGQRHAVYRKIHMFDVEVEGKTYRESASEAPGTEIVLANVGELTVGLSICYDLRFPELYRILAVRGARAFALPAAFTVPTGRAHWEVLIRARAIENQAFVIAAGQVGAHPDGFESYGHSMIVDPWGTVLACNASDEQVVIADLDLAEQDRVRRRLPSLANRRPETYVWGVAA
jgi:predicted amidohydrolase